MRLFRRTAGLWTVRQAVKALGGLREEVAGLRQEVQALVQLQRDALQRQSLQRHETTTGRGQGFVTAPPPPNPFDGRFDAKVWWSDPALSNPSPILVPGEEAGGIGWTDNRTLADYLQVEADLTSVLGHPPTPEEVEQEYRLRRQEA